MWIHSVPLIFFNMGKSWKNGRYIYIYSIHLLKIYQSMGMGRWCLRLETYAGGTKTSWSSRAKNPKNPATSTWLKADFMDWKDKDDQNLTGNSGIPIFPMKLTGRCWILGWKWTHLCTWAHVTKNPPFRQGSPAGSQKIPSNNWMNITKKKRTNENSGIATCD